jgi:hypothetical protein
MSYKDLLVGLDSDASARERIEIAAALAERFAAHLVGLYPLPMPEAPRHFGGGCDPSSSPGLSRHVPRLPARPSQRSPPGRAVSATIRLMGRGMGQFPGSFR